MKEFFAYSLIVAALTLGACTIQKEEITDPFDGIGEDEVVSLGGTEPFWGAQINGGTLTYSTPENIEGTQVLVSRFAGNGGLSFSGMMEGKGLIAMVTPGACSDGMSDRTYPFVATLKLGDKVLKGCAHTDAQPYNGEGPVDE